MVTHFYTASSLDGFIATSEHSLAWLFTQDFDMDGPMAYPAFVQQIGVLVMGRSTYEWLLAHSETWEYSQPTFVFSHGELPIPDGADVRLVTGGVAEAFPAIAEAAAGADVWVVGGGTARHGPQPRLRLCPVPGPGGPELVSTLRVMRLSRIP